MTNKKISITVYGVGAVGSAVSKGLKEIAWNEVIDYDIRLDTPFEDCLGTDFIFICLPSPSGQNGEVDMSIIDAEIEKISRSNYSGVVCLKSTVKPGSTNRYKEKYRNLTFAFVPEFLRERCAYEDFTKNHDLLVIGCDNQLIAEEIQRIHGNYPKKVKIIPPLEAELVKYFSNVYNALRITFANNFFEVCSKLNANYDQILQTYLLRGLSTGNYLGCSENLRGYGGMCLPKDTKALIHLMEELEINLNLIRSIDSDNSKYKSTVFEGMRE